jgi:hypothetical protein
MNEITLVRRYCEQSSATFEQPKSGEFVEASVYNGASSAPIQDLQRFFARVGENERLSAKLQELAQTLSDEESGATRINGLL